MTHILTQSEWEAQMCNKILSQLRNELYLDFRYLDMALSALTYQPDDRLTALATDGSYLYYPPSRILSLYQSNPIFLNRAYLHSVLHCIFRHLWMRGSRNPFLWNLSCDIAVEWIIDRQKRPSVKRILSLTRIRYYEHLKNDKIPVSAQAIYRDLLTITDPEEQFRLQEEFIVDDHRFWPREEKETPQAAQAGKKWEQLGRKTSQTLEMSGQEDADTANSIETQIKQGKSRRSYREFLQKFTVLKEELACDYDELDLGFYSYGLRIYKNMPLIEPSESREVMKIQEFVIVIDTSYSTDGELVRRFLSESFQILSQGGSFFSKSHIHIIQCDNQVQSDLVIRGEEDIEPLLSSFTLTGGGGTDFRPAFSYVDQLIASGDLTQLKGLLYFTDGKGIFPRKAPAYDTAFIFMEEEIPDHVPAWAMRIQLTEEDLPPINKNENTAY